MMDTLKGLDALRGTLNNLKDQAAKKAAKAGVNAGLQVLAKGIRQQVNGLNITAAAKTAVRKLVSKRLKKKEGQDYVGKAGFAVGRQSKAKREKAKSRAGDKSRRGVGISSRNIHWLVLGTGDRTTKSGHHTGVGPALLKGVVGAAATQSVAEVMHVASAKVSQVLATEAAKAKKG